MLEFLARSGLKNAVSLVESTLLPVSRSVVTLVRSSLGGLESLRGLGWPTIDVDLLRLDDLRQRAVRLRHAALAGANSARQQAVRLADALRRHLPQPDQDEMPLGGRLKRLLDIAVALTALIVLSPLLAIVAAIIYYTDGRPIFFAHKRVGFNGELFPCYKFRSMVKDAEARLAAYLASNPEAAREWEERQKLAHDPRITWIGVIIRKTSIDELPQLWNVIRGEMSCVGPRPIVKAEMKRYGDHSAHYVSVRPGMTGLWQVSGRSTVDYDRRVALDVEYVGNWSIWLDLMVLFKTVPALLKSGHAT